MRRLGILLATLVLVASASVVASAPASAWYGPPGKTKSYYPPIYCGILGASETGSTRYAQTSTDWGDECGSMGVAFRYDWGTGTYAWGAGYVQRSTQAVNTYGGRHRPSANSATLVT